MSNGVDLTNAFPAAPRTAFYAQYDEENGLWRDASFVQKRYESSDLPTPPFMSEPAALDNDNPNVGEDNRDPWVTEFSRSNIVPYATHVQKHKKKENKDIGEGKIDESVHTFSSEDTNVLPVPRRRK